MALPLRSIIEEHTFGAQLSGILPDARRADEFIDGATWLLLRDPNVGKRLSPDSEVWFLPIEDDIPDMPPVALYYAFDEQYIWLISVILS